jgi:hypothetical protein
MMPYGALLPKARVRLIELATSSTWRNGTAGGDGTDGRGVGRRGTCWRTASTMSKTSQTNAQYFSTALGPIGDTWCYLGGAEPWKVCCVWPV